MPQDDIIAGVRRAVAMAAQLCGKITLSAKKDSPEELSCKSKQKLLAKFFLEAEEAQESHSAIGKCRGLGNSCLRCGKLYV